MFVVHTSNCHGQNCTRRAIFRLGIDTLIVNVLVFLYSTYNKLVSEFAYRKARFDKPESSKYGALALGCIH